MNVFDKAFFDKRAKNQMNQIFSLSSFVESLSYGPEFVALRVNTDSSIDNTDSFVISTSSNPTDQITYVSPNDVVDLNVRDGGFF